MFTRSSGQPDRGASWASTSCLCLCHYVNGVACDDIVCATTSSGGAVPVNAAMTPRAAGVASSHRTSRTPFDLNGDIVRDPTIPRSTPIGVSARFAR